MATDSASKSRGTRAKTSSPSVDDGNTNNPDSAAAADSPPPGFQTPAPPPSAPLRRSLRLSAASGSASSNPNPSLCSSPTPGSAAAAEDGALGKRKGRPVRGRISVPEENLEEKGTTPINTGAEMGAGEQRRKMLRSGSRISVTNKEATPSNSSVAMRRPGRPKKSNSTDVGHQQQEEVKEMRDGDANSKGKEKVLEQRSPILRSGNKGKGKGELTIDEETINATIKAVLSSMDKGKGKMGDYASVSISDLSSDSDSSSMDGEENGPEHQLVPPVGPVPGRVLPTRRENVRNRAIELAPKFAFFKDEEAADSEGDGDDESLPDAGLHDWPGPFSTAMKIIEEREAILQARREGHSSKGPQSVAVPISWMPSRRDKHGSFDRKPPSLQSLCIKILADNVHEIESLATLPDMVRSKLVPILCQSRKMTMHHLSELAQGSPVELQLSDCSWVSEKEFEEFFSSCDVSQLEELQLDLCGRCLPDYVLRSCLASAPNNMPYLMKLSLKGAYSLSDDGLAAIISSAPMLNSLNLCQCSLLTSEGIAHLANNLASSLRELKIDNCQNVNAMLILPALQKANCLEVLSMAGIQSVSDKFVRELITVCGFTIKELNFSGCLKLTSSAIKVIGESCPQLSALDIRNLSRLKDVALGHLANGCRALNRLHLRRSSFSDEAIAAFVEASGNKLIELSLNNIDKVGHQTAIAISRRCCMCLQKLDLSFCRRMSDQALGLIVDSCSSLKTLKLFGCTHVTDLFLKGHSNNLVEIIGLGDNVLGNVQKRDFL